MAAKSFKDRIRAEDEKIAQAQAKREKMIQKARHDIGAIAEKAGLFDVEISEAELLKGFKELAARFCKQEKPIAQTASQNPPA